MIKQNLAKAISKTLTNVTEYSVNTACCLVFGQVKEPRSLARLKKHKGIK